MTTTTSIKNGVIEITGFTEGWTLEDDLGIKGVVIDSIQFNLVSSIKTIHRLTISGGIPTQ